MTTKIMGQLVATPLCPNHTLAETTLPNSTGIYATPPKTKLPNQTEIDRKDLQALNLESPKLRTPIAETDLSSRNEHPFVNTGRIDQRVFNLQFYHALPSIEHGASASNTGLTDTNNGHFAEPFILPEFINGAGTVILQNGMSQAEHGRLGERAFLAFLGSVDNGSVNNMRRNDRTISGEVQTGNELNACHFFIVGVGLDPFGRNFLQGFRKFVQRVRSLPVVHNHRARRNQVVTKRFPCHSCLPPGGKVKLIEPQTEYVDACYTDAQTVRCCLATDGSVYTRLSSRVAHPHCRAFHSVGGVRVVRIRNRHACTQCNDARLFPDVPVAFLPMMAMRCISCNPYHNRPSRTEPNPKRHYLTRCYQTLPNLSHRLSPNDNARRLSGPARDLQSVRLLDRRRALSANKNALRRSWRDITKEKYSTGGHVMQGAISCR